MRSAALAVLAALALAPAALAQDPPAPPAPAGGQTAPAPAAPAKPDDKAPAKPAAPAKHENKVTDAAKAAYAVMKKALHDPVASGLKDLQGNLVFRVEIDGMDEQMMEGQPELKIEFAVDFKAPNTLKVEGKTENPMLEMQMDQTKNLVDMFFLFSSGILEPKADAEYDADVVTEEGKKFLLVKHFEKNVAGQTMKLGLDAEGLPGKGTLTATDPMMGVEQTVEVEFRFVKDGEKSRFSKFLVHQPEAPEPMEFAATYAEAGGFKLMSAVSASIQTPMGAAKLGFKYDSLTVNGKKVELPKEEKKPEPKSAEPKKEEPKKDPAAPVPAPPVEKKPETPKEEPPK